MKRTLLLLVVLIVSAFAQASYAEFKIEPLNAEYKRMLENKNLWRAGCPAPLDRFVIVHVDYYDFKGRLHKDGKIMVMDAAAPSVMNAFKELSRKKFPLEKVVLTSEYNGDDDLSMADNNSSSFNCRSITGGSRPSVHSYGLAIDINPVQNPFVGPKDKIKGEAEVLPPGGLSYLNRTNVRPGMVDSIVEVFKKNGFITWGGKWNDPIDWQHFQVPRKVAEELTKLSPEKAKEYFRAYVEREK